MGFFDDYEEEEDPNQENYLDDSFGAFTKNLPIDQPSGSVVSGGREDLYHKYSQMLEQKPESERVLEDYMGRRPSFANYNPDRQTKLTAAVMGGISGLNHGGEAGIKTAQEWRNKPLDEAMQDYASEGRDVNSYAKLQDSSRNRQISSLLSQMRMQEQERNNRERSRQTDILRGIQQGGLEARQDANKRSGEDRKYARDLDERKFGETQRHNLAGESARATSESRMMESLGLREKNSLRGVTISPSQQLAKRDLNSMRIMSSDPAMMSALGQYETDPAAFLNDEVTPKDETDPTRMDARRKFAVYQALMQMLDQQEAR